MSVEIGWAILAIAMAIVGRTLKSTIAKAGAIVAWGLALAHLIFTSPGIDIFREHPALQIWLTINSVGIASTTIIAWGLAMVGHVIAGLMQTESTAPNIPIDSPVAPTDAPSFEQSNNANIPFATAIPRPADSDATAHASLMLGFAATIVFVATSILALPPLGATLSLIAFAWLTLFVDIPLPRLRLAMHSIGVLLIATIKWVAIDTLGQRLSPDWSATQYAPIVNPLMGIGLLLAASLVGAYLAPSGIDLPGNARAPSRAAGGGPCTGGRGAAGDRVQLRDRSRRRACGLYAASADLAFVATQADGLDDALEHLFSGAGVRHFANHGAGRRRADWVKGVAVFSMLLVAKFVLLDTLIYRLMDGSATAQVVFNLQTMTALVVTGSLVLVRRFIQTSQPPATEGSSTGANLHLLALFVVAWTGTFEIERFVILHPAIVSPWPIYQFKQMAWTMWWTVSPRAALSLAGGLTVWRPPTPVGYGFCRAQS